jgi:uncharacterized protein YuzE
MQLTYDPRYNIAYLRFHGKTRAVETIRVSDELNVDIAPDGTIYGLELLNANEQLRGEERDRLVVVNEARDEQAELPLDLTIPASGVAEKPGKPYGRR